MTNPLLPAGTSSGPARTRQHVALVIAALGAIHAFTQPFSAFVDASRARFLQPDVISRVKDVEWQTADARAVRHFLLERHSFSPGLVEKSLVQLVKTME